MQPYTRALISSIPLPDPSRKNKIVPRTGEIPSPIDLPKGCPFQMNCKHCMDICRSEKPVLKEISEGHKVACHLY